MRKTFKTFSVLMAVVFMLSSFATACGKPSNSPGTGKGDTGKSNYDAVINYGLTTAWDSLNPYSSASGSFFENLVLDKLYDRLAYVDEAGKGIEPRGALSWTQSDDGKSATFKLDPKAKFHDGTPVTAKDWVYTMQLITNPDFKVGLRSEFNVFAGTDDKGVQVSDKSVGVEATDDYTLVFHFKNVYPVEDWILLKSRYLYVLPEHILGKTEVAKIDDSDFWKKPIGSGPCTYISELSGSQLTLGSFKDYHLGQPKFAKLVFKVVSPSNTVTSVSTGELDYFYGNVSMDDVDAAKTANLNVMKSSFPTGAVIFLINNQNVKDKRVRQAMSYAVDKEALLQQGMKGQGIIPATYIVPTSKYYNENTKWTRDVNKAKELLTSAGWDHNKVLTMAVTSPRAGQAAIIQQNLKEAGIQIKILTVDLATEFSGLQTGKYDLGMCGSSASDYPLWMSGYYDYKNATYGQITDKKFAEAQDKIGSELDKDKRAQLVKDYQEILVDEMPYIMLYDSYSFGITSKRIKNVNPFESASLNDAVWKWEITK